MSLTDTKAVTLRARLSWRGVLAAGLLAIASSETTAAERGTFSPLCAAHDLKSIAAIEKAGELGEIASGRLAEAGMALVRGRILCLAGNEADAIATYEGVVSAVAPAERQVAK